MEKNFNLLLQSKWLLFALICYVVPVQSQTIVEVMVDQPDKFEIIVTDVLFTMTDNSVVFGESLTLSGGTAPYQYKWFSKLR